MQDLSKIVAVIVTHHPDITELQQNIEAALPQVAHIIMVDNGSSPEIRQALQILSKKHNFSLIQNDHNLGLAAAQNQGIDLALERGAESLLLLDDDSRPAPNMVAALLLHDADIRAPRIQEGAGKNYAFVTGGGIFGYRLTQAEPAQTYPLLYAIASGALIKSHVFAQVGMMRDAYFIDQIDIEFSLRARRAGFSILGVANAVLTHRIGTSQTYQLLGFAFSFSQHDAGRYFYMMRNRMDILKRYARNEVWLIPFYAIRSVAIFIRIAFFESPKWKKLKAYFAGIFAGFGFRGVPTSPRDNTSLSV